MHFISGSIRRSTFAFSVPISILDLHPLCNSRLISPRLTRSRRHSEQPPRKRPPPKFGDKPGQSLRRSTITKIRRAHVVHITWVGSYFTRSSYSRINVDYLIAITIPSFPVEAMTFPCFGQTPSNIDPKLWTRVRSCLYSDSRIDRMSVQTPTEVYRGLEKQVESAGIRCPLTMAHLSFADRNPGLRPSIDAHQLVHKPLSNMKRYQHHSNNVNIIPLLFNIAKWCWTMSTFLLKCVAAVFVYQYTRSCAYGGDRDFDRR